MASFGVTEEVLGVPTINNPSNMQPASNPIQNDNTLGSTEHQIDMPVNGPMNENAVVLQKNQDDNLRQDYDVLPIKRRKRFAGKWKHFCLDLKYRTYHKNERGKFFCGMTAVTWVMVFVFLFTIYAVVACYFIGLLQLAAWIDGWQLF